MPTYQDIKKADRFPCPHLTKELPICAHAHSFASLSIQNTFQGVSRSSHANVETNKGKKTRTEKKPHRPKKGIRTKSQSKKHNSKETSSRDEARGFSKPVVLAIVYTHRAFRAHRRRLMEEGKESKAQR